MSNEETLYARFISGKLTHAEEEALKQSGDWEKLTRIASASEKLRVPPMETQKGFARLIQERHSRHLSKKSGLRRRRWIPAGIAASLLFVVGTYVYLMQSRVVLNAQFATTVEHTFKDDSKVIMNAGSKLSYQGRNWSDRRTVRLNGEAYFEVRAGAPFVVKTASGEVRVLGTSFNVRSRNEDLIVECYQGTVQVESSQVKQNIDAGQALIIRDDRIGEQYLVSADEPSWTQGRSSFRNESLVEVFKELERQYQLKVVAPPLGFVFTGSFDNKDLAAAVREIASPFGLQYIISPDQKTVTFSE